MNTEISHLAARMKRLSRRHRLAHLRALVRREPAGSTRRYRLVALLLDQLAALPANENRSL
jgi:GcrA cell cycle regulator